MGMLNRMLSGAVDCSVAHGTMGKPPSGAFDVAAAPRGEALFRGKAKCATCHVPPLFTEPGWNLHKADEIGIDDFQAKRAPDDRYRTAPLHALWDTKKIHKGGYYHDGRFATLMDVVNHYDRHFQSRLSGQEKNDLLEYLKSLLQPRGGGRLSVSYSP